MARAGLNTNPHVVALASRLQRRLKLANRLVHINLTARGLDPVLEQRVVTYNSLITKLKMEFATLSRNVNKGCESRVNSKFTPYGGSALAAKVKWFGMEEHFKQLEYVTSLLNQYTDRGIKHEGMTKNTVMKLIQIGEELNSYEQGMLSMSALKALKANQSAFIDVSFNELWQTRCALLSFKEYLQQEAIVVINEKFSIFSFIKRFFTQPRRWFTENFIALFLDRKSIKHALIDKLREIDQFCDKALDINVYNFRRRWHLLIFQKKLSTNEVASVKSFLSDRFVRQSLIAIGGMTKEDNLLMEGSMLATFYRVNERVHYGSVIQDRSKQNTNAQQARQLIKKEATISYLDLNKPITSLKSIRSIRALYQDELASVMYQQPLSIIEGLVKYGLTRHVWHRAKVREKFNVYKDLFKNIVDEHPLYLDAFSKEDSVELTKTILELQDEVMLAYQQYEPSLLKDKFGREVINLLKRLLQGLAALQDQHIQRLELAS